ncbi:MAG: hypothetical protein JWM73_12 [Solirubrobacterales bacterium]|nr:hypothetical protein [Solirubrobacterales bacterium]
MINRILPSAGIGLALVVAFAGCGGSKLSGNSIEKLIVTELGNRGYANLKVNCPDVDNKVGKKFTCDVTGAKAFTKVEGTVAKDDTVNLDGTS